MEGMSIFRDIRTEDDWQRAENRLRALAGEEEFDRVAVIPVERITIRQDFRIYCEENSCGNYGVNYGCPPDCGTPQEMEERVRRYRRALVIQTRMEMDDVEDTALTREIRREHNRKAREVGERLAAEGLSGLLMLPGPCSYCAVCQKIKGNPCLFPEKRTSCLSAYGVDVTALAVACGMRIDWDGTSVSYLSLFLYREDRVGTEYAGDGSTGEGE
ncbi:MAG: DUF2284 domain-containing protein [Lachnospiraceae bacterium]|nr:DUF2284 domain-containing protein [Lachnospiraceae bacterium]